MKNFKHHLLEIITLAFIAFGLLPGATSGQGSALLRSCSGTGLTVKQAKLEVTKDGDVNITPCDNRAVLLRGSILNGSGTVQSVGLSLPNIFTVSGSPITSAGLLAATFASQSANTIFAAPNGSAGTPSFRTLAAADIPAIDASKITSGTIPTGRLGSGTPAAGTFLQGNGVWSNLSNVTVIPPAYAPITLTDADSGKVVMRGGNHFVYLPTNPPIGFTVEVFAVSAQAVTADVVINSTSKLIISKTGQQETGASTVFRILNGVATFRLVTANTWSADLDSCTYTRNP